MQQLNSKTGTQRLRGQEDVGTVAGSALLIEGLTVQLRSIQAMVLRELVMRYGRSNIGFLWVVLEPMILTIGVMTIWSSLKSPYEHGLRIIAIVMTGYMPLTLFRHMTSGCIFLYRRNMPLLYHRKITLIDVLLSKSLLEFSGTTSALFVVYSVLVLIGLIDPVADVGLVVAGWMSMGVLAFGLASVFAAATEASEPVERFLPAFQYLLVPLSGCFFMVEWLPKTAQELIWYMPLVHCFEMFRAGFFGESVATHWTWWYPLVWGLGLTTIGFGLIEAARARIHTG